MRNASLFLLLSALPLLANDFRGSWKHFLSFTHPAPYLTTQDPDRFGHLQRFRGIYKKDLSEKWHTEIAYDLVTQFQSKGTSAISDTFASSATLPYRIIDIPAQIYPQETPSRSDFTLFNNIDRLLIRHSFDWADLTIGRQAINFGSAKGVNPTDVLAPFNNNAIDQEYRRGIDAVRLTVPLGELSEFDFGFVFGDSFAWKNDSAFLRIKTNFLKSDVALLYQYFLENHMVGLDIQTSAFGAGVWIEAAHVWVPGNAPSDPDYFRLTIGADYKTEGELYIFGGYHFNGPGADSATNYVTNLSRTAYREGGAYLLGRHYFIGGFSNAWTPLLSSNFSLFLNLQDGSTLLGPTLEYNLAEDLYLAGGAFINLGRASGTTALNSEFGAYADFFFASLRLYF